MPEIYPLIVRSLVALGAATLCACAVSQPAPARPSPEGKAVAERLIRPHNGTAAIVFDEKGQAVVVNREGQIVQPCQVCTPEMERKYGPRCAKARPASDNSDPKATAPAEIPQICTKLAGTNVLAVKPISVLRHTGSECMTFFFDNDGLAMAYQYCW